MSDQGSICWIHPNIETIEEDSFYVVLSNEMKKMDHDPHVMKGWHVKHKLASDYIRVRPIFIAKINYPEGFRS
jgi:hypothetical protein